MRLNNKKIRFISYIGNQNIMENKFNQKAKSMFSTYEG